MTEEEILKIRKILEQIDLEREKVREKLKLDNRVEIEKPETLGEAKI